jgi:predicted secreted Zn-dependent protease
MGTEIALTNSKPPARPRHRASGDVARIYLAGNKRHGNEHEENGRTTPTSITEKGYVVLQVRSGMVNIRSIVDESLPYKIRDALTMRMSEDRT